MRITIILLLCWMCVTEGNHPEFMGGSISYQLFSIGSNKYRVDVTMLTGWVLGTGPCGPGCDSSRVGTSTLTTRRNIQQHMSNDIYFGNFTLDYTTETGTTIVEIVNDEVHTTMSETVLAVNENAKWEQEITQFSFTLPDGVSSCDINFDGSFWRKLTLQNDQVAFHLQSSINTDIRSDTTKPNRCPQASCRPYYRVKLNTTKNIQITTNDPDFDQVNCSLAQYRESGNFKSTGVIVNQDCTVDVVATEENGYSGDTWLAVRITVKDYNKNPMTYGNQVYPPISNSITSSVVQFAVNILEEIDGPMFVPPTPPAHHEFIVFAGAEWNVKIFAKASENTTIHTIKPRVIKGETITCSAPKDTDDYLVSSVQMSWYPTNTDTGAHIICVDAEDNTGVNSDEERCYNIIVKEERFTHTPVTPSTGNPVFVDIPSPTDIINCPKKSTCNIPLYVSSSIDLKTVRIVYDETKFSTIATEFKPQDNHHNIYKVDLSIFAYNSGRKQVCLVATDVNNQKSQRVCIWVHIEPDNPCISGPCQNSGTCLVNRVTGAFRCECKTLANRNFTGDLCKIEVLACTSNNCKQGMCSPKFYTRDNSGISSYCYCNPGYGGYNCDHVVSKCPEVNPCSNHGVCISLPGSSSYICQCNSRYTGKDCEYDVCPSSTSTLECIPDVCKPDPCNGNGICHSEPSGAVCTCSLGYTGQYCNTVKTDLFPSVTDIDFVPPTPRKDSSVVCFEDNEQLMACSIFVSIASSGTPSFDMETSASIKATNDPLVRDSNDPQLYQTNIQLHGGSDSNAYICLKVALGTTTKERCLFIVIKSDPVGDNTTLEYAQQNAEVQFIQPTLNEQSEIVCNVGETCMIMLYTTMGSSGCKQPASPNDQVKVFPVRLGSNNICVTETSFMFNSAGDQTLCFQSAHQNYQQRCFIVHVYQVGTDPCLSKPCKYNGHCMRTDTTSYKCECALEYTGTNCEKGPCSTAEDICTNGAYCYTDNGIKTCHCPKGYIGHKCEIESIYGTNGIAFTDTAKPIVYTCVVDNLCSVLLMLSVGPSAPVPTSVNLPKLSLGYIDPELSVSRLDVKQTTSRANLLFVEGAITGMDVGLFDACLQAKYKLNDGSLSVVEECFQVDVTSDLSLLYERDDRPHFIDPSLSANSKVVCTENKPCHVLYHVIAGDGNDGKCISYNPTSKSGTVQFHLFSTCDPCTDGDTSKSDCKLDISINTPPAGTEDVLCLRLKLRDYDITGEKRCFHITSQSVTEEAQLKLDSCQNLQCQNDGFCDGHLPGTKSCYCTLGYSGPNCDDVSENTYASTNMTFISDMSIPQTITCMVEIPCTVPFKVMANKDAVTSLSIGYAPQQLRAYIEDGAIVNGSSVRSLNIRSTAIGTFKTCVQIKDDDTVSDEVCITVIVKNSTGNEIDKSNPYFYPPTLPDQTEVICQTDTTCHMTLYFTHGDSFGHPGKCPTVQQYGRSPVRSLHVFEASIIHDKCVSEVAYIFKDEQTPQLCFQLSFTGIYGEKRCYYLKTVEDARSKLISPCKDVTCYNKGQCIGDPETSITQCICRVGYTGSDCNTELDKSGFLPGVEKTGALTISNVQRFGMDSAIPRMMPCIEGSSCYFYIAYGTNINRKPVYGFTDPLLTLYQPSSFTLNDGPNFVARGAMNVRAGCEHRVCLQTTSDGSDNGVNVDEICIQVTGVLQGESVDENKPYFVNTMPNGTVVSCFSSQLCHLYVITLTKYGKCEQIRFCDDEEDTEHYVFTSEVFHHMKCWSEIALKPGNVGDTQDICLSAGLEGEQRHFIVETIDGTQSFGGCQKLHCMNGGSCLSKSDSVTECSCTDDFTGYKCHLPNPCKTFTCHNGGVCKPDLTTGTPVPVCFCTAGFKGDTCSTPIATTSGLNGIENLNGVAAGNQNFMSNGAVPTNVTCDDNTPCCVYLPYYGDATKPPILGYHDKQLLITSQQVLSTTDTNLHSYEVCVNGTSGQTHRLCLQTTTDGTEQGVNIDEMCMDIDFTGVEHPDVLVEPKFINTLSNGTTVSCVENSLCHLQVVTQLIAGKCLQVEECDEKTNELIILQPNTAGDKCLTDVILKSETAGDIKDVCVSAGYNGEKRQILVETKSSTDGHGPCQKIHCQNGGKCVSLDGIKTAYCTCPPEFMGDSCDVKACVKILCDHGQCIQDPHVTTKQDICLCDTGYTGDTCSNVSTQGANLPGVSNLPIIAGTTVSSSQHFDGNSAVPSEIKCDEVNPCCLTIPYHGNETIPPIIGYHSPGLIIDHTKVISDININDTSILITCMKGIPGNHKVCLQTSSDGTNQGMNVDEVCVSVSLKEGGTVTPQTGPHFIDSLPDMTEVKCNHDTTCQISVMTEKNNGGCSPVTSCTGTSLGARVHDTKDVGEHCLTYIGLKTSTNDRSDTLCLSSGSGGEERHFIVKSTDMTSTGPCQTLHCKNGGSCVSRTTNPVCECLPEYTGNECELNVCYNVNCQHGGKCVADLKSMPPVGVCVCVNGYNGQHCETPVSKDTDIPGVDNLPSGITSGNQHFGNNIAIPREIVCDDVNPCCLTIPYEGDSTKPPIIGYMDPSLSLDTSISSTIHNALGSGSHTTSNCVTGISGSHKLCIQTTSDGTDNGVNMDEICVTVKKANTSLSVPTSKPHFTNTLPNGTKVECQPHSVCHLTVVSSINNDSYCETIEKCIGTTIGMSYLQTTMIGDECITDIALKTGDTGSTDNLCLATGPDGEERHFEVATNNPPAEGYGPCQKLHCINGGKCSSETGTARCTCLDDYLGETCSVSKGTYLPGLDNVPNVHLGNQHFIKNGAIPSILQCDILNPCCISIPYNGDSDAPPVLGYHDQDLTVFPILQATTPDPLNQPNIHIAEVCTKPKLPNEKYKLCLQTTSDGTDEGINVDEICLQVQVKPDENPSPVQPSSFNPKLPDGSTVLCMPDSTCHVVVVTDKHGNTCDQVAQCGQPLPGMIVSGTVSSAERCITDIKVTTGLVEKTDELCIKSSNGNGENRHIFVQTKNTPEFGPCQKMHCLNGGKCLSSTDTPHCKCFDGFSGVTCERNETQNCRTSTEEKEYARQMVVTGYASCSCIVNGKNVDIIKKKPVPENKTIVKAVGFGAGGMTSTLVIGIVIYVIVNKLKASAAKTGSMSSKKRMGSATSSASSKQKVHPKREENLRNLNAF